jgi:hypothetical protein
MSVKTRTSSSNGLWNGTRVVALLVTLAAPIILYLIIKTGAGEFGVRAASALPPADHRLILRQALPTVVDPRVRVPYEIVSIANKSALQSPLRYEPFIIMGRKAADEGRINLAISLLEEARQRRANFLPARLLLMAYYGQANRPEDAIAEMDYSMRSSDDVRRLIFPELVKLIRSLSGRRILADVLARQPAWRAEFARHAEGEAVAPEQARELLELVKARQPDADFFPEQGIYIQALIRSGRAAEARETWLATLPPADRARSELLFDGSFTGLQAPQPFGWRLQGTEAGRAEMVPSGNQSHLDVAYFGGNSVLLAEQVLTLKPGTYRISFKAKSDGGIKSGALYWTLSCLVDGPALGRILVEAPPPAYRTYQAKVDVPTSCSAQEIRLTADPGDVSAAFDAQIAQLKVTRQ